MPFDYKLQAAKTDRNKARRAAKRQRRAAHWKLVDSNGGNDAHKESFKAAKKASRARRLATKALRAITASKLQN